MYFLGCGAKPSGTVWTTWTWTFTSGNHFYPFHINKTYEPTPSQPLLQTGWYTEPVKEQDMVMQADH